MARVTMNRRRTARTACSVVLALSFLSWACVPIRAAERGNLALNKPACSSSIENDEHSAAQANDGDPETCWRADDEPEDGPEWWQVDLEKPFDLSGCQIRWPFDWEKVSVQSRRLGRREELVAPERSDKDHRHVASPQPEVPESQTSPLPEGHGDGP